LLFEPAFGTLILDPTFRIEFEREPDNAPTAVAGRAVNDLASAIASVND
jgi:hypothetical protein